MFTKKCEECGIKFEMDIECADSGYCCVNCYIKHIVVSASSKTFTDTVFFKSHIKHFLDKDQVKDALEKLTVDVL